MKICVVYLLREQDHAQPFFESYLKHAAGVPHDLMILEKGNCVILPPMALQIPHREAFVSDFGRDLHAYGKVCRRYREYDAFCFLNSYSVILVTGWLKQLFEQLKNGPCGAASASSSFESFSTNARGDGWLRRVAYPPYPNYHIRTNALLIRRDVMMRVWPRWILTKDQAHLFESGYNSMTKRILRLGLGAFALTGELIVSDNHVNPENECLNTGIVKG